MGVVYRIEWKRGQPYIEHGEIILSGKKGQIRRIKWPSEQKTLGRNSGSTTIKLAFENEIDKLSLRFGDGILRTHPSQPWLLASCISRLMRLARKLEKRNLLEIPDR